MNGIDDYGFEAKNRWRRMMWHDVAARLKSKGTKPDGALVVYLAGAQDLDREIAVKKGFSHTNMIAVEADKDRLQELRAKGVNTIDGNIVDVVRHWTYARSPDVLYADLCSNLQPRLVHELCESVFGGMCDRALAPNAVVLLNFQRGRETKLPVAEKIAAYPEWFAQFQRDFGCGLGAKHRGLHFLFMLVSHLCGLIEKYGDPARIGGVGGAEPWEHALCVLRTFRPRLHTYQSNRVLMDSVILTRAVGKAQAVIPNPDYVLKELPRKVRAAKRSTAAALAHRTMRSQA